MSLHFDVKPQIEARFTALARQQGIDPTELFESMVIGYKPSEQKNYKESPKFTAENDPLIARLEAQLATAPTDPNEIKEAEADMQELMRNLNANRRATGERIPFPKIK